LSNYRYSLVHNKNKKKPPTGRARKRKQYNKRILNNPQNIYHQCNRPPNQGVVRVSKSSWNVHEALNYEKGIIMGNGHNPLAIRPRHLEKWRNYRYQFNTHHQDTMSPHKRLVRVEQIEKKNLRCYKDWEDWYENLIDWKLMEEIIRRGVIRLYPPKDL